jgi:hypothetical protein
LYTCQWSDSVYVSCWQEVTLIEIYKISFLLMFIFSRAPLEEMARRAGIGGNNRGQPIPDGPPVNVATNAADKGFTFTPLP